MASNPFSDLESANLASPSRYDFLKREDAQKVLDACLDTHWRLLFALARFGGFRISSAPRWEDVNWEQNRILVRSPKTKHHPEKDDRIIPWFPAHVVCAWLGNSETVAKLHDLQKSGAVQCRIHSHGYASRKNKKSANAAVRAFAESYDVVQVNKLEDNGLEPMTFWLPATKEKRLKHAQHTIISVCYRVLGTVTNRRVLSQNKRFIGVVEEFWGSLPRNSQPCF